MGHMGWGGGGGMGNFASGGGGGGAATRGAQRLRAQGKRKPDIKKLWPLVWVMLKPRMWILAGGLGLTAIKVLASLTIPQISKRLVDTIINVKPAHPERLPHIVIIVFTATLIQAISSYALTQLLSKEGQRLIADLRARVQRHVGLLPVSYYDANSTGTLVARIMSDVEGVRNLIGTGLVEFAGSILTAVLALTILLQRSVPTTLTVLVIVTTFAIFLQFAFKRIRPVFRERGRINAEVSGRLTESLGGVRVIKGYHAEEREAKVFAGGVERLLKNVVKSLTMTSMLTSASATVTGVVSVIVIFMGGRLVLGSHWTMGDYFQYNLYLAFMISPVFQIVNIGTQLTEALAGLDRTNELLGELEENEGPERTIPMPPIDGHVR